MASKYSGRGLTFSVANKKDFVPELEEDFGLGTSDGGELPFVTIRTKLGHKYTMREEFTYVLCRLMCQVAVVTPVCGQLKVSVCVSGGTVNPWRGF